MSAVTYYRESEAQDAMAVVAKWMGQNFGLRVIYHDGDAVDADIFRGVIRIPKLACSGGITEESLMLLRGRIYHEAGHIAFTNLTKDEYPSGIHFQITNAVEDRRMEREVYEEFPGAKNIFRAMMIYYNKKIAERAASGPVGGVIWEALVAMSFQSEGVMPLWRLSDKARKYFDAAYDKFCEWKGLKDAKGSVALAKEILEIMKEVHEEEREKEQEQEQEPEDNEETESEETGESEETDEGEGEGEGSDGEGEESESEESGEGSEQEASDEEESDGEESGEGSSSEEDEEGEESEGQSSGQSGDFDDEEEEEEGESSGQSGDFDDEEEEGEEEGQSAGQSGDFDDEEEDGSESSSDEADGSGEDEEGDESSPASEDSEDEENGSYDDSDGPEETSGERTEEDILKDMEEELEGLELSELQDEDIAEALSEIDPKDAAYLSKRDDDEHRTIEGTDFDKTRFKDNLDKVSNQVSSLTAALVQVLRARARCKKQSHQRRGRLDRRRLVAIAKNLSKDVFYTTREGEKMETAIEIIVDESSSMSSRYTHVRQVVIAIGESLSQLGIPFEVTGTTTKYVAYNAPALDGLDRTNPIVYKHYKTFGQGWDVVKHGLSQMSSHNHNIDGETVEYAARRLAGRKEARKIIFSLSDGQPVAGHGNNETMGQNLIRSCERARESGIEVYGLGVGTMEPARYYGRDNFVFIPDGNIDESFAKAFVDIVGGIKG